MRDGFVKTQPAESKFLSVRPEREMWLADQGAPGECVFFAQRSAEQIENLLGCSRQRRGVGAIGHGLMAFQ